MSTLVNLTSALVLSASLAAPLTAYAQQAETSSGRSIRTGQTANPDPYQGPNGHYNNEADFTRDLNGVPCGINCSNKADERNMNGR